MARDPNERVGPGQYLEKPEQFKTLGIAIPQGFVVGTSTGQYYAHYTVHADGHTTVEWYKRGSGGGGENPDPVALETPGVVASDIKAEWDKEDAKAAAAAAAKPSNVIIGVNPSTGKPSQISEYPDPAAPGGVRRTYDDTQVPAGTAKAGDVDWHTEGRPDGRGGFDNAQPIMVRTVNGVRETREPTGAELQDWNIAGQIQRNPGGQTDAQVTAAKDKAAAEARAEAERTRPGAPTLKPDGKGGTVAVQVMPDGTIKTTPLPGVPSDAATAYVQVAQDPKTGVWTGLTKEGQWVPISGGPGLAPEKPTIRPGQEGRPDIQYVPDPKNPGQVIAVPIQGTGTSTVALPEGFARPQFSPMQVSAVLGQTQQKLDTWVQGATDENDRRARMQKATELMAQAHQEATTYLNEQQIGTTAARDVYGNQISERGQTISRQNQLTSSGAGMANQAVGTLLPLLRYAQAGSGDAAKALVQLMGVMRQSVGDMGGLGAAPATIGVPGILGPYMQGGAGAPAAAPGVSPVNAPGTSAGVTTPGGPGGPAPAGASAAPRSYDPNQWDQGPNGTLVPRQRTPGSSAAPAAGAPVPDAAAAAQMAAQQQAAAQAAAAAVPAAPTPPVATPPVSGHGDPGFYRPDMQGSTPTDPGFYPPGMQGPDTTDPGFFPPGMQGAPQGMQGDGGMPPLAVMQALLQHVEPMMQADPNWGVNDLAEIQLGRSPWG